MIAYIFSPLFQRIYSDFNTGPKSPKPKCFQFMGIIYALAIHASFYIKPISIVFSQSIGLVSWYLCLISPCFQLRALC